MKAAIVIAVENYSDPIGPVTYAATDAARFAAVLEQHGFSPANQHLLVNERATKASIESTIRTTLAQLAKDDTLFLFYAGHGLAIAGENYLTSHDSRRSDLAHTCVAMRWIFQQLTASPCQRTALFLDICHRGLLEDANLRSGCDEWNPSEIQEFFAAAEHGVCFIACQHDQLSHGSPALQHGIWTHHLIEAFDGRARAALAGNLLTAASLQNYLQLAVPLTLRTVQPTAVQTPSLFSGGGSEDPLADLAEDLSQRNAVEHPLLDQVQDSILLAESIVSVHSLSGFNKGKGHFIPERYGHREQAFINEVAADDLTADVEHIRAALKNAFNFTRRELKTENQGDGGATISTPYFNYNINIFQDAADPSKMLWRRSVDAIIAPDKVLSSEFAAVFAKVFNTVQLSLRDSINLEELIDSIEALRSDQIRVSYDEDENITSCIVTIRGYDVSIKITPGTFSVIHSQAAPPKLLLKSLLEIQQVLMHTHPMHAISFKTKSSFN